MFEVPVTHCESCGESYEGDHYKACPGCGSRTVKYYRRRGRPRTEYIS